VIRIDQIIGRVGEECVALMRARRSIVPRDPIAR
jgi:hypothetical protein